MKRTFRSLLPFSNAHWSLPVMLWLAAVYLVFWEQCSEKPRYLTVVFVTATVCIALWNSHVRERPLETWRSIAKVLAGALYDLLLLLLWLVPLALILPSYDCYSTRAKVQELFSLAVPLELEIESRTKQHGSIVDSGIDLKVPQGKYLSGGVVNNNGTIVLISTNLPAAVMLVPEFSASTVTWKCTGFPKEHMPLDCRD